MIRGAIDYFDGEAIGGWIHCDAVALRDRTLLAFVDAACVGAGRVDRFRQDLADAGLGDGYCGFRFGVTPPPDTAPAKIVVKLENSDLILLRPGAIVIDPAVDRLAEAGKAEYGAATIAWMRARGWLDRGEADFLTDIATTGLHDLTLSAERPDPVAAAQAMLALYRQTPVAVQETLIELRNLADERTALIRGAATPILALHAPHGKIALHDGPAAMAQDGRLLFVDARRPFAGDGAETARVYRAVAASGAGG